MSLSFVDSHCHIPMIEMDGGIDAIVDSAREQGIDRMLCVSVDMESYPALLELAGKYDCISASVGVHPNTAMASEITIDELVRHASDPRVVAIGETGLDYFRSEGDLDWQRDRFRNHIRAAKQVNKPLIIHCREAKEDVLRILKEEGADEVGGVMHCFVEDMETALRSIDLNFYISFSGIVTFKTAVALQQVASQLPESRILIETDSPYLAPVPYRGRQNQPAYVRHVAESLARLRETSLEQIASATTANYYRLFSN
jgi:TatD DNase family protein